jgi:hypothetical protein
MNYYFSNTQGQIERLTIIEKFENNPNTPEQKNNIQSITTPIPSTVQPANSASKSGNLSSTSINKSD